ncbi:hypothetical protein LTR95_005897 [Oleoguttula sp. CCFEE 5521]
MACKFQFVVLRSTLETQHPPNAGALDRCQRYQAALERYPEKHREIALLNRDRDDFWADLKEYAPLQMYCRERPYIGGVVREGVEPGSAIRAIRGSWKKNHGKVPSQATDFDRRSMPDTASHNFTLAVGHTIIERDPSLTLEDVYPIMQICRSVRGVEHKSAGRLAEEWLEDALGHLITADESKELSDWLRSRGKEADKFPLAIDLAHFVDPPNPGLREMSESLLVHALSYILNITRHGSKHTRALRSGNDVLTARSVRKRMTEVNWTSDVRIGILPIRILRNSYALVIMDLESNILCAYLPSHCEIPREWDVLVEHICAHLGVDCPGRLVKWDGLMSRVSAVSGPLVLAHAALYMLHRTGNLDDETLDLGKTVVSESAGIKLVEWASLILKGGRIPREDVLSLCTRLAKVLLPAGEVDE